ncbi:MAG TPA: DUF6600 domain-containing protein [Edaphocola sp.]|nr:DUF6600 domain-containing protein [Edaphocola sp.]
MKSQAKIKTFGWSLLFSMLVLAFSWPTQSAKAQPGVQISFQTFYDNLAPYGTWLNDPQYGYVWSPRVSRSFRPYYTDGYWVNTDYGNMWMSEYPWGWAAFHYGRWAYSDYYGWIWIPGDEWGPAWVSWRQGDGYYGWAPMGPGITINVSFGSGYYVPDAYWTFIPYGYLYSHTFHRYYSPRRTRTIIHNTTIINNTYVNNRNTYVTGPRRQDYEHRTGRSVTTYQVGTRGSAGRGQVSGRTVSVYRPAVNRTAGGKGREPRPAKIKEVNRPVISKAGAANRTNGNVRQSSSRPSVTAPERPTNNGNSSNMPARREVNRPSTTKRQVVSPQASRPAPVRKTPAQSTPRREEQRHSTSPVHSQRSAPPQTRQRVPRRSSPSRHVERSASENTPSRASASKVERFRR